MQEEYAATPCISAEPDTSPYRSILSQIQPYTIVFFVL